MFERALFEYTLFNVASLDVFGIMLLGAVALAIAFPDKRPDEDLDV